MRDRKAMEGRGLRRHDDEEGETRRDNGRVSEALEIAANRMISIKSRRLFSLL